MVQIKNMNEIPLLSIVIPTRNRFNYVRFAIKSILRIPCHGIQLIIEDNSDTNECELWIKENIFDDRLIYHYSQKPISMRENYDRAIANVTGEYCCLIGDDDGVNPEIVNAVNWAKENHLDAIVPINSLHYVWPDLVLPAAGAISPGELRIGAFIGKISFPNVEEEILKCIQDAGQKFHDLPKVYYGIIKTDCMYKVKEKTGTFFPGISPDIAIAISCANFVNKMCLIDYPLFVPGSSLKSNAGLSGLGKHKGLLKDQSHLPDNCEETWSNIVPPFYSVETVWAESTVQAIIALGRMDILGQFNVPKLYSELVMWHFDFFPLIFNSFFGALKETGRNKVSGIFQFIKYFSFLGLLRFYSLLNRFNRTSKLTVKPHISCLNNIDEAVLSFVEYLKNEGIRFESIKLDLSDLYKNQTGK